ncbi:MAG TPA: divergent polysaccharide deacetylase family protein, partial [Candidatus Cloacimonetes bacterium]|nr:divergent polysaccharide deacetylase family protein [Candidatus Cloacimonadota bacterium]
DFGYTAGELLNDFADLPPEIVFAVMPDLAHTKTSAEKGAAKGHAPSPA